jgi:hypothetical protein
MDYACLFTYTTGAITLTDFLCTSK